MERQYLFLTPLNAPRMIYFWKKYSLMDAHSPHSLKFSNHVAFRIGDKNSSAHEVTPSKDEGIWREAAAGQLFCITHRVTHITEARKSNVVSSLLSCWRRFCSPAHTPRHVPGSLWGIHLEIHWHTLIAYAHTFSQSLKRSVAKMQQLNDIHKFAKMLWMILNNKLAISIHKADVIK